MLCYCNSMTQKQKKFLLYGTLIVITDIIFILILLILLRQPSLDREWSLDQAVLPHATITDHDITITNIRNFSYTSDETYTPAYYNKTFKRSDVVSVDYIVEPLASVGVAHTLLSFGLRDGSQIVLSVEIRKEIGETFSPILGLFRSYELMYVVMDEQDALKLRAIHRDNPVYLYPTKATPKMAETLLISMLNRMNKLSLEPEFYNTITSTCTTNILDHLTDLGLADVNFDYRILLPKESDTLAYENGLLDIVDAPAIVRDQYLVSDDIKSATSSVDFSLRIRQSLPSR